MSTKALATRVVGWLVALSCFAMSVYVWNASYDVMVSETAVLRNLPHEEYSRHVFRLGFFAGGIAACGLFMGMIILWAIMRGRAGGFGGHL